MKHYGSFVFAAPQATATPWFELACIVAELGGGGRKSDALFPVTMKHGCLSVSLVRHPYDWLVDLFLNAREPTGVPEVDEFIRTAKQFDTSARFIEYVARHMPGQIGRMFAMYKADSYLRVEEIRWATVELFSMLGIDKDLIQKMKELPNPDLSCKIVDPYNQLRGVLCESEKEFCEYFEYHPWGY